MKKYGYLLLSVAILAYPITGLADEVTSTSSLDNNIPSIVEKDAEQNGYVLVRHILEETNELLGEQILNPIAGIGDSYTTKPLEGPWLIVKQIPDNATGVFTAEDQIVTYLYERGDGEPVTVEFVDENGNKLLEDIVLTGKWGLDYESQPATIDGWKLTEIPVNAKGVFTEEEQLVTYVYTKQEEPGTEKPGTEKPGTEEPGTEEPGTEEPGTEKPGTEEPGTEEPGTEEPGTEELDTPESETVRPNPTVFTQTSVDKTVGKSLPQTGEQKSGVALVGTGLSLMSIAIYFFTKKK
ncbi:MucBP domain-containing protein [Enterococcus faecalis]